MKHRHILARDAQISRDFRERIPIHPHRLNRRRTRDKTAEQHACQRNHHDQPTQRLHARVTAMHQFARRDRAGQNRDESRHPDQTIARDHLFRAQSLRQKRIFRRPEHRRMRTQQQNAQIQHPRMVREQTICSEQHDEQLKQLHPAHDRRFIVFIRQLPRRRRQQQKRHNEQTRNQITRQSRCQTAVTHRIKRGEQGQAGFEQIVIERAGELRQKKR